MLYCQSCHEVVWQLHQEVLHVAQPALKCSLTLLSMQAPPSIAGLDTQDMYDKHALIGAYVLTEHACGQSEWSLLMTYHAYFGTAA